MSELIEIPVLDFQVKPFQLIGKDWMLIAAEKQGAVNAMTAAWGGLGVMWAKNVAFVVIRPQRYTKEFVDAADSFSLNFFGPEFRKQLGYFGAVSGRDEDKIAKTGMRTTNAGGAPHFVDASAVLVCRKLYAQRYGAECFLDKECDTAWYPEKDYHQMYIAEVTKALVRQ